MSPPHILNWTCLLIPAGTMPMDDDAPECQACRIEVTRQVLAEIRTSADQSGDVPRQRRNEGEQPMSTCDRCGANGSTYAGEFRHGDPDDAEFCRFTTEPPAPVSSGTDQDTKENES